MPTDKSSSADLQPQRKDQDMYEELRREGNSKEKSARISNAAASYFVTTDRQKIVAEQARGRYWPTSQVAKPRTESYICVHRT